MRYYGIGLATELFEKEKVMSSASAFWWEMLKSMGAVYECPKDSRGKRLGPMVMYAGTDEIGAHYVGDVYVNLAVLERRVDYLGNIAHCLLDQYPHLRTADVFCGAPEGGKSFAVLLAQKTNALYCYPDQEVEAGTRNKKLVFLRHEETLSGKRVVIVEDVLNNFSTTDSLVSLIEKHGGTVVAITGILNWSLDFVKKRNAIPVSAVISRKMHQYRQNDGEVQESLAIHELVCRPKAEWAHLVKVMKQASAQRV